MDEPLSNLDALGPNEDRNIKAPCDLKQHLFMLLRQTEAMTMAQG